MADSTVIDSTVIDSTVIDSAVVDSAVVDSAVVASAVVVSTAVASAPRARRPHSAILQWRRSPWWLKVFLIWLASRVVTTALLEVFAHFQPANAWTGRSPGYLAFAQMWDSTWYHIVAANGYPSVLPHAADGFVLQNAWAFLPGYPLFVRGLMGYTGLSWELVSVATSTAFSLAAALMLFVFMRRILPASAALFSVVLFCVQPLSPILQVSYAESMAMFLLILALFLLVTRHYGWLFPVVAVLCFTRPLGLAFALALGIHVIYRFVTRARDPFSRRQVVVSVVLGFFTLGLGFAWSGIAWLVTGTPDAYLQTEMAWRADYLGHEALAPFVQWWHAAAFWGAQSGAGVWMLPLLAAIIVAFAFALTSTAVKRLGVDVRIWLASYALYLLAVFFPQSSIFRLLMPMFPFFGVAALPKSRSYRIILVVVFIAAQAGWLFICWWIDGYDWTPP